MQKRSSFLTFLTALIPGVGYMYLGLVRRGLQVLIAFLLIEPVFRLLGIGFLGDIIRIPIWFYTFFDTFSVARMMDMGETVNDSDFIFNKYANEGSYPSIDRNKLSKNLSLIIALVLILLGAFAILNNVFQGYAVYQLIRSYISKLFIPILLVFAGIYMLFKNRKQ